MFLPLLGFTEGVTVFFALSLVICQVPSGVLLGKALLKLDNLSRAIMGQLCCKEKANRVGLLSLEKTTKENYDRCAKLCMMWTS